MINQLSWTTEKRKVNDLLGMEKNPRKISEEKKQQLIKSIEKFNLAEIPAINKDDTIIAGHQRIKALQIIGRGEEMIDVRIPNRLLTDKEIKEYMLISNTHAGEWDFELLETDFAEVDFDLVNLDFNKVQFENSDIFEKELDSFIKKQQPEPEAEEDDFEIPEEIETEIVLGDLFEIGEHRLLCGDSTDSDTVARLMNGEKADMVFTDPPYNVSIKKLGSSSVWDAKLGKSKKQTHGIGQIHDEFPMGSGEMSKTEFLLFLTSVVSNLILFSTDGSIHYLCMDWRHIEELMSAGSNYTELKNLCVWNKDNGGMGSFYRSKHELIFVYKNGTEKHINNFGLGASGRYRTNVWDYPKVTSFSNENKGEDKLHPTTKPLRLVADTLLDCSNVNNIISDLFLGSGTTMVASHQLNRKCYGMELDPKYCQVIVDRMRKLDPAVIIKKNGEIIK